MSIPGLCGLLHHIRNFLSQHPCWRIFVVYFPIGLRAFSSLCDQDSEIRTHSRVHDADVGADYRHLIHDGIINEDGRCLLLSGNHDAIRCWRRDQWRIDQVPSGMHAPLIPRLVVPCETAARACSIWTSFPLGENTVRE